MVVCRSSGVERAVGECIDHVALAGLHGCCRIATRAFVPGLEAVASALRAMEFRILGVLEVVGEHGALALGALKPRAVLALLLLHRNRPVSADRLAVALWGEEAPRDATRTVQVYVSRVRRALGDPEAIATTPAGYR